MFIFTHHYWFLYKTASDAFGVRRWAHHHSNAFDESPIIDRVPLQYYNQSGETVIRSAIIENERDSKIFGVSFVPPKVPYMPPRPFMFLESKEASVRDKVRSGFTIGKNQEGLKTWFACKILFEEKIGWFLLEEMHLSDLGISRIL